MKKLIVLLLALAMVGAVSAQVTTAIGLSGGITLVDQAGQSIFARDGAGTETITFKGTEKDGKYGFSVGFKDVLSRAGAGVDDAKTFGGLNSWNAWFLGKYAKVKVGLGLGNSTFRTALYKYWKTAFGRLDGISGYGVAAESTTLGDLVVGTFVPVPEAATDSLKMLTGADLGAKYTLKGVGVAQAYVDLATGANKVGLGFTYTAMKGLTASVITSLGFEANNYRFGASAKYTGIEKLVVALQASDSLIAGANSFDVYAEGGYDITDAIFASAWAKFVSTGSVFTAGAFVDYSFANGLTLEANAGYDFSASALNADLTLYYGVAF